MKKHNKKFVDHTNTIKNGWKILFIDPDDTRLYKRRWIAEHLECNNRQSICVYQLNQKAGVRCKYCRIQNYKKKFNSQLYKTIKNNAKLRNLEFNLTKEFLLDLIIKQNYICAISGLPIWIADSDICSSLFHVPLLLSNLYLSA